MNKATGSYYRQSFSIAHMISYFDLYGLKASLNWNNTGLIHENLHIGKSKSVQIDVSIHAERAQKISIF